MTRFRAEHDLEPLFGMARFLLGVCAPIMAMLLLIALGAGIYRAFVPVCDPDPWACFGAGRYDAMRDGRVCECYDKEHLR
jgi:hypothetical protein